MNGIFEKWVDKVRNVTFFFFFFFFKLKKFCKSKIEFSKVALEVEIKRSYLALFSSGF
jgi:hypothetical protein